MIHVNRKLNRVGAFTPAGFGLVDGESDHVEIGHSIDSTAAFSFACAIVDESIRVFTATRVA
jgi:hypothetical protein